MKKLLPAVLLSLAALQALAHPMVSPEIDATKPFSYYSRPTDQFGVMDAPKGFMVTSEGYVYNRAAELLFLYGPALELVHNRQRTLMGGHYPVIEYSLEKEDVRYSWQMFAFTEERGKPRTPLHALVKVTMKNIGNERRDAYLASGLRHVGTTTRIEEDKNFLFQRETTYEIRGNLVVFDDNAVAVVPEHDTRWLHSTIDNGYAGAFKGPEYAVTETTPVCLAGYQIPLGPGESQELIFVMPNVPTDWRKVAAQWRDVDLRSFYETKLAELKEDWDEFYARGVDLQIPEDKVQDTFLTSLMNIAISKDDEGNGFFSQGVNEMQYVGFFPRDSMYFAWSWYFAGYLKEAWQVMHYYEKQQHESGKPMGRFYNDQENIAPFSMLTWYRKTHDLAYGERIWPRMILNFNTITNDIANDPLKLMPAMGPYDNEGITGHYTAHNFYNLKAFEYLADLGRELGHTNEARVIRAYADGFGANLMKYMEATIATNGFITPGLDTGKSGAHWGNMEVSYPTFVLGSRDPRVKQTIDYIRQNDWSEEGLIMFNALGCHCLHHYNTMKASMADLYLGRDRNVVQDLYGVLLHTSSTHGFFEFCLDPWSNRDFGGNVAPHGWGHAKYISLIRNMLVREDECSNLFLLSALSPCWVLPGKEVVARRFPTLFGNVDQVVRGTRDGLEVDLCLDRNGGTWGLPRGIFMKVPYFAERATVFVDGAQVAVDELGFFPVPLEARKVEMKFKRSPGVPTYKTKVSWYIDEYARRFDQWRRNNRFTQVWECFPETTLETFTERKVVDQKLKQQEGLMTRIPVLASSTAPGSDAKYVNDGIASDRTPKFWRPAGDDQDPWFECVIEEPVTAWCLKLMLDNPAEAKAKVYLTTPGGETELVGDTENSCLPIHGQHFVCTFGTRQVAKVRVEFKGRVGRVFECSLHASRDCWKEGVPQQPGKVGDIAYSCPVFTSPSEDPTEPALVDGQTNCALSMWGGAPPHPQWAIVDLGSPQSFSRIRTYMFHDGKRSYSYRYLCSDDMKEWRDVAGHEDYFSVPEGDELTFEPVTARYVMIRIDKNTDNPAGHVSEIEIYAK